MLNNSTDPPFGSSFLFEAEQQKQKSAAAERWLANSVEQKFNHRQKKFVRGTGGDLSPPIVRVHLCLVVTTMIDDGRKIEMIVSRPV